MKSSVFVMWIPSKAIFAATEKVISEGKYVTYDLGGNAKLSEMTEAIAKCVEAEMKRFISYIFLNQFTN
jgi:isocitrate dehydrogenase (NADP) (EC 1.1.1.42)